MTKIRNCFLKSTAVDASKCVFMWERVEGCMHIHGTSKGYTSRLLAGDIYLLTYFVFPRRAELTWKKQEIQLDI